MNSLQKKIYSVIKAIVEIDDFENCYAEHAISYGLRNYVAKYSLSKDEYLITEDALHYLNTNNLLNEGCLRRGIKNSKKNDKKNNGFTYEHPIPSKIITDEIVKNRKLPNKIIEILNWSDLIVIVTKNEDKCLQKIGLQSRMPIGWKYLTDSQFERYKIAGLLTKPFQKIKMYGSVVR
tara:strand:- start:149 stop:682 length:534 start_codon:yes stop_codon:yes gene_type:complete